MVREERIWCRSVPQSTCNGLRGRVSQVRILPGPLSILPGREFPFYVRIGRFPRRDDGLAPRLILTDP